MRVKNSSSAKSRDAVEKREPLQCHFGPCFAITSQGWSGSPNTHAQESPASEPGLGLAEMPCLKRFPKVKPNHRVPWIIYFQLLMSIYYKQKDSEWVVYNSEYFSSRELFINNRCCRVIHATTLGVSLICSAFCRKGYSSHGRVTTKHSGFCFFPPPTVAQKN